MRGEKSGGSRVAFDESVGGQCFGGLGMLSTIQHCGGWREMVYFCGGTIECAASARWSASAVGMKLEHGSGCAPTRGGYFLRQMLKFGNSLID